jgi:hypothetical protein
MDLVRSYVKSRAERAKGHFKNFRSRPGEQWKLFRGQENQINPTNNPNTIKSRINQARLARNNAKKIFMNKNLEIQKLKVNLKTAMRRKNQINRFMQKANRIRQIHSSFYQPKINNRAWNQGTQTNNRAWNQGTQTNNRAGLKYNGKLSNNDRRAALINQLKNVHNVNELQKLSIPQLVETKQNLKRAEIRKLA